MIEPDTQIESDEQSFSLLFFGSFNYRFRCDIVDDSPVRSDVQNVTIR